MKKTIIALVGVFAIVAVCSASDKPELKEADDQVSYSIGYQMGSDFKRQGVEIRPEALMRGVQDALNGSEPQLNEVQMRQILTNLKKKIVALQQEKHRAIADKNMSEGSAFLAENSKKEGVNTTPSGLQYRIIKKGSGASPKVKDTVTVHYQGHSD